MYKIYVTVFLLAEKEKEIYATLIKISYKEICRKKLKSKNVVVIEIKHKNSPR